MSLQNIHPFEDGSGQARFAGTFFLSAQPTCFESWAAAWDERQPGEKS